MEPKGKKAFDVLLAIGKRMAADPKGKGSYHKSSLIDWENDKIRESRRMNVTYVLTVADC